MARFKILDGVKIAYTAEEEAARDAEETAWAADSGNRAMSNLRDERTAKLRESDWMANSDVTMGPAWKGYRQQLRDLPANYTTTDSQPLKEDLSNLEWPTKP
jgi:hypothetical protein